MRYPVTIVASLIGFLLCLYNSTGYDPHNFVFFMFSVPAWFADMIMDIHNVNVYFMYVLTIASYALLGYICDWTIARTKGKRRSYD